MYVHNVQNKRRRRHSAPEYFILIKDSYFFSNSVKPPTKQQTSELQLNAGDGQYVVAYTLKPPKQAQPDILNPPPGTLCVSGSSSG